MNCGVSDPSSALRLTLSSLKLHLTMYPAVSKKCAALIWANDFDVQTLRGGVLKTHIVRPDFRGLIYLI